VHTFTTENWKKSLNLDIYKIEYAFDKETGKVTATIPELNHVSSYGDTFEEAEKNIREAALCYLEALEKEKNLFLKK